MLAPAPDGRYFFRAMNEMPDAEPTGDFATQPAALWLGAALIGAFALIVLLAFTDRAARSNLETARDRGPVVRQR